MFADFFAVFILQKPDSSSVLGKSDLQIVSYVIEFLALAQFCIHKCVFAFILFETIGGKISETQTHDVLIQKVLGTKLCDASKKLIVWNNL